MRSPPRQRNRLAPDGGGERRTLVHKNREASDFASEASLLVLRPLTMWGHRGGRLFRPEPQSSTVSSCFTSTDVRFGSKADIRGRLGNVRFTPKSGHCIAPQRMSALCHKETFRVAVESGAIRSPRRRAIASK